MTKNKIDRRKIASRCIDGERGIGTYSYRSSFAKKRLPLKEITSHGGAIIFLPYIYIYTYTSSLTDRERSRTEKKKKGESSQSQDNLPLKTFAKPRQRELCFVVEMPVVPPRRLFVVEKSTTGIHVVSSFVSAFLNAPHQKDESKDRGGLLFPPSPFPPAPLCPNSTLPSSLPLSMVFFETQKNR